MVKKALTGLVLLVTTAALASEATPPIQVSRVRAALDRIPVSKHDKTPERAEQHAANLEAFAQEIARVSERAPLPPRQWAALLVAIGGAESHYDTEVTAGRCLPAMCDHGKARSAFQVHRLRFVEELWDNAPGNIAVQVDLADKVLRKTWGTCLPQGVAMPQAAFRGFAGVSCSWPMRGEALRVGYYNRAMGAVVEP